MSSEAANKSTTARGGKRSRKRGDHEDHVPSAPEETAEYLATILPELATLADRAGMELTSYLLRMAHRDAQQTLMRDR